MARRPARRLSYGNLDTIEYIGPRPQVPKKRTGFFGGWVILLIALGVGGWCIWQLFPILRAEHVGPSVTMADSLISELDQSPVLGNRLAAAALQQTKVDVSYDSAYYKIPYPNGDVPKGRGNAEDVIIRSYRAVGVDLQQLVHDDMAAHFNDYPQLWNLKTPDTNVDHRRVQNLQRFFARHGKELPVTDNAADYLPGDVVVWSLANGQAHVGIVAPGPGERHGEMWVVHNMASSPKWENALFDFPRVGHYRYTGQSLK